MIPPYTACPYWDDLFLTANTNQGIWYQIDSTSTTVTIEYILGRATSSTDLYQFQVVYSTLTPGVWVFKYYVVGNYGASASVGVQGGEYSSSPDVGNGDY